mmetsp:Transcript_37307/g.90584  ORF Transcript_37307/g.90584 Transcript_37307/m.90584 type:complete len:593 (-) Transcript_37307:135-1913(-)
MPTSAWNCLSKTTNRVVVAVAAKSPVFCPILVRWCMLLSLVCRPSLSLVSPFLVRRQQNTVTTAFLIVSQNTDSHRYYVANTFLRMAPEQKQQEDQDCSSIVSEENGKTGHSVRGTTESSEAKSVVKARMVSSVDADDIEACGKRLREGNLVAFPTETVFGLGSNALDPSAISKIFEAKERPLTDPLISHVSSPQTAYDLWENGGGDDCGNANDDDNTEKNTTTHDDRKINDNAIVERRALHALCERFWPGPLTIVAKAKSHVPGLLMANTGFVACRSPKHGTARALIDAAGVPICAPSANKFGHVSPTKAQHVWDDLKEEDVWILQGNTKIDASGNDGNGDRDKNVSEVACEVGVESSVVKIEMLPSNINGSGSSTSSGVDADGAAAATTVTVIGKVTLLRQGAISVEDIKSCLADAGLFPNSFVVTAKTNKANKDEVAQVAPGQTIRHYSPNVPSFILKSSSCPDGTDSHNIKNNNDDDAELQLRLRNALKECILIDFGSRMKSWQNYALSYRDLSEEGNSGTASQNVFDVLRWAEGIEGASEITRIIFPEIVCDSNANQNTSADALTLALKDRLTRAASGQMIDSLLSE